MRKSAVALAALAMLGCTTVRAPISSFDRPLEGSPGGAIEPQLELWLESGKPISEREKADAAADARAALEDVVAVQTISPHALGAAEPVLFVRERAVVRTASRRHDQVAAKVGIVVGAVLVAVAVIAGASHSGDVVAQAPAAALHGVAHGAAHAAPLAAGAHAVSPLAGPVHAAPWIPAGPHRFAPAPWIPSRSLYAPAPYVYLDPFDPWLDLALENQLAQEPYVLAPKAGDEEGDGADDAGDPHPPEPPAVAAPPPPLALPALPAFPLEERGFFSGDDTQLELDLFDRSTGQLLWNARVERDIDPRDRDDLDGLFAQALEKQPWAE